MHIHTSMYSFRGVINDNLFLPVEPEITDSPDNMTLVEGNDAVFTCVATARPRPTITWWVVQNGGSPTMITSNTTKYGIAEMPSGERVLHSMLEVFGAIPSDAGTYICVANNPTNIPAMAQAVLTVLGMYVIYIFHCMTICFYGTCSVSGDNRTNNPWKGIFCE